MTALAPATTVLSGRYMIYGEIASGGMATVLYGRLLGPVGFARAVAIKRLHAQFAREPEFVSMFIDEARICARLSHANLVPTLDVLEAPGELSLIMEYVHGLSLDALLELSRVRGEQVPLRVAVALVAGVLHGLHAAHEARSEHGEPLAIVHRDVSPQNVLISADGIPRVLDFGIARARGRLRSTPSGEIKGKLSYMAPEQLSSGEIDRRVDIYGAAAVLWELLVGRTLFDGPNESNIVNKVLHQEVAPPSAERPEVPEVLDAIVRRALSRDPAERFASAREMASALERALPVASQSEVGDWLESLAGHVLAARQRALIDMQRSAEGNAATTQVEAGTRRLSASSSPPDEQTPGAPQVTAVRTRRVRRRAWLAAVLLGALLGLALLLRGGWREKAETVSEAPSLPSPAVEARPPSELPSQPLPSAELAQPTPQPTADGEEALGIVPSADRAEAGAQADQSARPRAARRREAPAKRVLSAPRARDCSQPYVIDREGVKRWKPECL